MSQKLLNLLISLLLVSFAMAQTSGKISGVIKDKGTGEGLPGVNIAIVNTTLGSSTDVDGFYVIQNVPVGVHDVTVTYVGYKAVTVKGVRVNVDNTTEVSASMEESLVEGDVVEVIAKRELINKNQTNSRQIKTADEIKNLPVTSIAAVVSISAGVVKQEGSNALNVRGGRGEETAIIVDGVSQTSVNNGGSGARLNKNALEEITVQAGGFSAEFGGALSGLVLTTTKTGGSKYKFLAEGTTDALTSNPHGYKNINFSLGGPLMPDWKGQTFFVSFDYLNTKDANPAYINKRREEPLTTYGTVFNFKSQLMDQMDLRLGGSYDYSEFEPYGGNGGGAGGQGHHRAFFGDSEYGQKRLNTNMSGNIQLTHTLDKSTYYTIKAGYLFTDTRNFDKKLGHDWASYGNVDLYRHPLDKGDGADLSAGHNYTEAQKRELASYGAINSSLAGNLYYGIGLKNPGSLLGTTTDNPYNLEPHGFTARNAIFNSDNKASEKATSFSLDFFHKMDAAQLKAGFGYKKTQLKNYTMNPRGLLNRNGVGLNPAQYQALGGGIGYDIYGNDAADGTEYSNGALNDNKTPDYAHPLNNGAEGAKYPISSYGYITSEIVLKDFIMTLGLRADYFDPNWLNVKDLTKPKGDVLSTQSVNDVPSFGPEDVVKSKTFTELQPRLGFSFPVDENTKFSANYSRMTQMPLYNLIYTTMANMSGGFGNGNFTNNPNLKPTSTVSYEVAVQHQITSDVVISIGTYYREIKDLVLIRNLKAKEGNKAISYSTYANQDYTDTKGLELTLESRRINNVQFFANLTYSSAVGTGSAAATNNRVTAASNREDIKFQSNLDFDVPVQFNSNIDYRFSENEGPTIFGSKMLENFGVNLLFKYSAGRPYTKEEKVNLIDEIAQRVTPAEGQINQNRAPSTKDISLRFDKSFKLNVSDIPVDFNVYLDVQNVFNIENVLRVYRQSGLVNEDGYLATPAGQTDLKLFSDYQKEAYRFWLNDPTRYGAPRQIKLGLRVEF